MERFESVGFKGGVWQGILHRERAPDRVILTHHGETVAQARVTDGGPKIWRIAVAIPADRLSDGVQTFILLEDHGEGSEAPRPGAERLAVLPVLAGAMLDEDIPAELALLKAEVELLKREFRRMATTPPPEGAGGPGDQGG